MDNTPKTYATLVQAITAILPNACFGEDNEGQLVIYTDLMEDRQGNVTPFVVPEMQDTTGVG